MSELSGPLSYWVDAFYTDPDGMTHNCWAYRSHAGTFYVQCAHLNGGLRPSQTKPTGVLTCLKCLAIPIGQ